jgi:hypothetical protein
VVDIADEDIAEESLWQKAVVYRTNTTALFAVLVGTPVMAKPIKSSPLGELPQASRSLPLPEAK